MIGGIESGSFNASRVQGHYAYPVQHYNNRAVDPVTAVRGGVEPSRLSMPRDATVENARVARDRSAEAAEFRRDLQRIRDNESGPDAYSERVFRSREQVNQGMFLDILG